MAADEPAYRYETSWFGERKVTLSTTDENGVKDAVTISFDGLRRQFLSLCEQKQLENEQIVELGRKIRVLDRASVSKLSYFPWFIEMIRNFFSGAISRAIFGKSLEDKVSERVENAAVPRGELKPIELSVLNQALQLQQGISARQAAQFKAKSR